MKLAEALLMLGDWDAAETELTQAADADGLTDHQFLACFRAWLAALRGNATAAQNVLVALKDLRASEDPQSKALLSVAEGFTADALRQPKAALRHAQATLAYADTLGISHDTLRWAWPLAARAAHDLRYCHGWPTAHPARLPAARPPGPDAAGRTRPGPRPPRCQRRTSLARRLHCGARLDSGSRAPLTTWPTGCSITPPTSSASAIPRPRRPPSKKPRTSPAACAASPC